MSKNSKRFVRIVAVALAVLMALSVLVSVMMATAGAAPTQSQIDKLEQERDQIQQQMQDIESEINSLEYEQSVAMAKKSVLDQKVDLTQQEIDNLTAQIAEYEVLIDEKEVEVRKAEIAEEDQWDQYKVRIRAMEENGTISYFAIIFGARDFTDMLGRIDVVDSIMDYDEQLYQDLVSAREATEKAKADLEAAVVAMGERQDSLVESQALLEQQVEESIQLLTQLEENISAKEELYAQVSAEEDKLKDEIMELEEALKNAATGVVGTGNFIWPSQYSSYITSLFGLRGSPTAGASSNHKGVDIAGSGIYGTNVLASDGGTVLTSAYSSSYGNYITISHGNGYTTLYAHMSKRLVSAGDSVSQGQVIGLVGSTGISTGAHLHFEVWENGTRINPLSFFDSSTYTISPNA